MGVLKHNTSLFLLGNSITTFMAFYRENLPQATVLPKMHILEEHILPFMEKWHVGCGLLSEQGAEKHPRIFQYIGPHIQLYT